jgi:hypothetical protein
MQQQLFSYIFTSCRLTIHDDWDQLRWCSCRACGVEVLVKQSHRQLWLDSYPQILHSRSLSNYLTLATRAPDTQEDLLAKAYDTYSGFLKSIGSTITASPPSPVSTSHDETEDDETEFGW